MILLNLVKYQLEYIKIISETSQSSVFQNLICWQIISNINIVAILS